MHSLDELLHPITPDRFMADYYGRKPLHIPAEAGAPKAALTSWAEFNALLSQTLNWTSETLKLVSNGANIAPEFYCEEVNSQAGRVLRPSPAKVEVFLSTGASLIAGDIHTQTPALRGLSTALGRAFAGQVGANAYLSFGGVRALASHFDLHEVFAIQIEGEKVWRLYENRAENPVGFDMPEDQIPAWLERTRGRLLMEVHMKPGDVLYLPRGWYHDALAQPGASLHVTWSVTPLYGRILFSLLESAALQDPAFRAWLTPAGQDGGRPLQQQLTALGQKLAALAAHPRFADEIAMTQERLVHRTTTYDLPNRKPLTGYRRTNLAPPAFKGPVAVAMEWAFSQPDFAVEDLCAQFPFVNADAIHEAVGAALRAGALSRV
jgi:lysine-specific demethylase/histidyl-hydroxylase NO66